MRFLRAIPLLLVGLLASQAEGAIVGFNINQTWSQGTGQADITATTVSLGGAGQFTMDPGSSGLYFDFTHAGSGTFSTINTQIEGYYFLRSYSAAEGIGLLNFGDNESAVDDWDTILVNGQTAGVWGASHAGYLGFRSSSGNYGWIGYSFTRANGVSTLTLNNGAYESQAGAGIAAGSTSAPTVPEPATLMIWSLGALGCAIAAYRRKRLAAA
jgi:hypothetical protein